MKVSEVFGNFYHCRRIPFFGIRNTSEEIAVLIETLHKPLRFVQYVQINTSATTEEIREKADELMRETAR